MEEIERLLVESEQDAGTASSEAMRLIAQFGNDPLLMEFVATANQIRDRISRYRLLVIQLKQQQASSERGVKVQLLLSQVSQIRNEASQLANLVREIGQND